MNSWLGDARYAEQAFDMAIVRAVEQRRYLIRASTSGPSAIVDPTGRVVVRTVFPSAATITGLVALRSTDTVYARFGDAFAWGCFAVAVAAWTIARRRRVDASGTQDGRFVVNAGT